MDTRSSVKKVNTYFSSVVLTGALVLLGLQVLGGCSESAPQLAEAPPQAVRVIEVRQGPMVEGRRFLGAVVAADTIRVLAEVPGTVVDLPVDVGALAGRGALVVRIGAPEMAARVARVKAEQSRAQQAADFACSHVETDRQLAASGVITSEQLDVSETNCASASAALAAAGAARDEAGAASAKTAERAPFAGRVLEHFVSVGQTVMPGTPLVLYGTEELELLVRVPQAEIAAGVTLGAAVTFEGGRGKIREIGGHGKGPGALVDVRVSLSERSFMVGATVPVQLVLAEAPAATSVPVESIGSDERGDYVMVVDAGVASRLPVTLGPRASGWVAIEPAPPVGTRVITRGVHQVSANARVLAVEAGS